MKCKLILLTILSIAGLTVHARDVRTTATVSQSITLSTGHDLHITSADALTDGATVTLTAPDAWLFFDNVKPNDVVQRYARQIIIGNQPFDPEVNGRIAVYQQGAVVMAQGRDYAPLTATAGHQSASFIPNYYYSNRPPVNAPVALRRALSLDNAIHHIHLARGYMATLACEPDGMGYSRVFIADTADIDADLPVQLSGKVSFVRVMRWQYPSKKGWVGSTWNTMPDGLKYAFQQADKTNSTWYYNWGPSATKDPAQPDKKTYNQEFVPEKWGAGGLWDGVYSIEDVSHLLGYNEPDHHEQSNVTVEKAIEEWPLMMQTGLRLGSPATTNFTWLYNFMDQCRRRNYRVDYVVVHAYWGGMSASEWYRDLKAVHDRTHRPIWIKEWNNGANWTKEGWPSSQSEQYQRQLRDLTAIVHMLDTCSFIERYSLYNWVEDKRMVIDKQGNLTPAGEMYAADTSRYFFNRQGEVIPQWTVSEAPSLAYDSIDDGGQLHVSWTDDNGEQIDHYAAQLDGLTVADSIHGLSTALSLPDDDVQQTQRALTVVSAPVDLSQSGKASNAITLHLAPEATDGITLGETLVQQQWQPMLLTAGESTTGQSSADADSQPVVFLGTPTYRNKMPLAPLTRRQHAHHFDFALRAWLYQDSPSFYAPDTLAFMVMPQGRQQWGAVTAEAGEARVDTQWQSWQHVNFTEPFATTPVVITSLSLDDDTTATVALRNVSPTGFDACLRHEGHVQPATLSGRLSFLAATPGQGTLGGRTVEVGLTADHAVGNSLTAACTINYNADFSATPYLFAQMQTSNDTITSTLRQQKRSKSSTQLFKDREKAVAHELVTAEQVGYIAIGSTVTTAISPTAISDSTSEQWFTTGGLRLSSRPLLPGIYIHKKGNRARAIAIH